MNFYSVIFVFMHTFGHSRDSVPPVMFSVGPRCAVDSGHCFVMTDWLSSLVTNRDPRSRRLRSHFNAVVVMCQQLVIHVHISHRVLVGLVVCVNMPSSLCSCRKCLVLN